MISSFPSSTPVMSSPSMSVAPTTSMEFSGDSSSILQPMTETPFPTPYLTTSSPIASFSPSPPSVGLSTNYIVGIAVGVVVALILVILLTIAIVFCVIRSFKHKKTAVTPMKPRNKESGKDKVVQVKHGEATSMDSLPKSA